MLARVPAKAVDAVTTFLVGRYGVTEECARYQAEHLLDAALRTGTVIVPPAYSIASDELAHLRQVNENLSKSLCELTAELSAKAGPGAITRRVIADLQTALKAAHTALGELS